MHGDSLTPPIQNGLGVYYLLVMLLNLGYAAYLLFISKNKTQAIVWIIAGGVFLLHAFVYFGHLGWMLPQGFRGTTTRIMGAMGGQMGPILYVLSMVGLFVLFLYFRKFLTQPLVAW